MWNFSIARALGLMIRTAPFLLFRALVYVAIAAALAAFTGAGAVAGQAVGALGRGDLRVDGTIWGALAGFGLAVAGLSVLRDRLLHAVKAGQLALMVDCLDRRPVPFGLGQIAHARAVVDDRFGPAASLLALHRLVRGVVGPITGLVDGAMTQLPVPGLSQIMALVRAWLRVSGGLVDEVVLAHALRTRSENAWEAAHDGLVLYAQNARQVQVGAVWITLAGWALAIAAFVALLGPVSGLAGLVPDGSGPLTYAFALIFAWAVKAALIEPFALACMLQLFAAVTAGQDPQPEWRGRLTQMSDRFRQLGERAVGWLPLQDRAA